jgi:hypothetical protein
MKIIAKVDGYATGQFLIKLLAAFALVFTWSPMLTVAQEVERERRPGGLSRFYKPEPGVFYRYGNFCGPQFPRFEKSWSADQRMAYIVSIDAMDSIDRACKWHDLCYEVNGHDNFSCDRDFSAFLLKRWISATQYNAFEAMPPTAWRGSALTQSACGSMAAEIGAAVGGLKLKKRDVGILDQIDRSWNPAWTALNLPLLGVAGMLTGKPSQPGSCWFQVDHDYGVATGIPVAPAVRGASLFQYPDRPTEGR